ncbi:hypothetical protein [Dendronalium sp. ChiSLP03b]|uniref:hypothetical protein n=1 Tax=Dendronalium sp. ChiSLP03b TaxID=3075381 RepID=UPI002AD9A2EA|nr:hypothetical protein [Dendronalium sp. ChiSLP03b]
MSSPLGGFADLKELRTRRGVPPVVGGTPSRRVGSSVRPQDRAASPRNWLRNLLSPQRSALETRASHCFPVVASGVIGNTHS